MTKTEELTKKAKEISRKFHWHFDKSLRYREQLHNDDHTVTEKRRLSNLLCDAELNCIDLDNELSKVYFELVEAERG